MLAVALSLNPLLVYNTGFQLSVAAVFGILLLAKPLRSLETSNLLRSREKPGPVSNLLSASLAAQISTVLIVAASFDGVSVIVVLTNLIAVPLSGPILTLGLLASMLGNAAPVLAYPLNASNGFLATILEWVALAAAALPFATVTSPGITPLLVGLSTSAAYPPPAPRRPFQGSAGRCGPQSSSSGLCCGSRSSASGASRCISGNGLPSAAPGKM